MAVRRKKEVIFESWSKILKNPTDRGIYVLNLIFLATPVMELGEISQLWQNNSENAQTYSHYLIIYFLIYIIN